MQVLVTLVDAAGGVATRDQLVTKCWGGLHVGDDSLNRAISGVRRALREAGAQASLETVPKIGYRLLAAKTEISPRSLSRRRFVAVGATAALVLAGLSTWRIAASRRDPRVVALIQRGREALRDEMPDSTLQGIAFFKEAVRVDPQDAEAWGVLALAYRNVSEFAPRQEIAAAVRASDDAAQRALALNPEQADAHAALALIQPIYGDWLNAERRLRSEHARFPQQTDIIAELALLMFAVGRAKEAAEFSAEATSLQPLSPVFQYRRAYHLWTTAGVREADQTIDRAMELWPTHPAVWYARMLIFAGSGRAEAAARQLTGSPASQILGPELADVWRKACRALLSGTVVDRDAAIEVSMSAARASGAGCVSAILVLSLIHALDAAFTVANGYLLRRGPLVTSIGENGASVNDQRWRKTMMLFVPATAAMRADSRFETLCRDMGLAAYWQAAGVVPFFKTSGSNPEMD